jgi:hypothetical protein
VSEVEWEEQHLVLLLPISPHHQKIISAEAEILQFHPRLFSADKIRLFPVDCAHSLNGCLHRHADNLPIVTILSMPKLVKTLVSPSS